MVTALYSRKRARQVAGCLEGRTAPARDGRRLSVAIAGAWHARLPGSLQWWEDGRRPCAPTLMWWGTVKGHACCVLPERHDAAAPGIMASSDDPDAAPGAELQRTQPGGTGAVAEQGAVAALDQDAEELAVDPLKNNRRLPVRAG